MNTFDFTEINNLINECNKHIERGKIRKVNINGCQVIVFENGDIYRNLKLISNKSSNSDGCNQVRCGNKLFKRHRIIGYAFLGLDIYDTKCQIDHIDGVRLNNYLSNLRIVTNHQNQMNRTTAKGYSWIKRDHIYTAQIYLNRQQIHLGRFKTEEEARAAYNAAKLLYHII